MQKFTDLVKIGISKNGCGYTMVFSFFFLPTQMSEWNLMEGVWQTMLKKFRRYSIPYLRSLGIKDVGAYVENDALYQITHEGIIGCYKHCQEI